MWYGLATTDRIALTLLPHTFTPKLSIAYGTLPNKGQPLLVGVVWCWVTYKSFDCNHLLKVIINLCPISLGKYHYMLKWVGLKKVNGVQME